MKVVYVYNYNASLPGVNLKIIAKLKWLKDLGVNLVVLCFTNKTVHNELADFEVVYVKPYKIYSLPKLFNFKYLNFLNQIINDYRISRYYQSILLNIEFDLLIMRYNTSNYFLYKLISKFKYKFIFEHNTIELNQLKLRYQGILKSQSWISFSYFSEKLFGPKVLVNAAGLIGVTDEITNYEKNRFKPKSMLPLSTTISNGINVTDFPLNSFEVLDDNIFNLVMILGVNAEWHGLSRIINGINNYHGNKKITLYIIGNVNEIKSKNVVYLGSMNLTQMNNFFENTNIHLGVASLALHKINIKEASVLKAREYLARGIPFLYGYNDTDLDKNESIKSMVLKVPATDDDIDINRVLKFFSDVQKIEFYRQKIRDYALHNVDMSVKMNQYKKFLEEVMIVKAQIK